MMIWPVPGHYTVTSGYADSRSYGLHGGFDIAAPAIPTVAVDAGIVIFVGWAGSAGRSVYIELEGGYRVHYCHLSSFNVVMGQAVAAGDVIGLVGGSGYEVDDYYGSHLHLNLFASERPATGPSHWVGWVGMWAVDPELYLGVAQEEDEMTPEQIAELKKYITGEIARLTTKPRGAIFVVGPHCYYVGPGFRTYLGPHAVGLARMGVPVLKIGAKGAPATAQELWDIPSFREMVEESAVGEGVDVAFSNEDLRRIAKAVADEQYRRQRE